MSDACARCDGYALVPGPAQMLERCPDCFPAHCPVHGTTVRRRSGVLIERCAGCVGEAIRATGVLQGSGSQRQRVPGRLVA
jgi:hypothetical protein